MFSSGTAGPQQTILSCSVTKRSIFLVVLTNFIDFVAVSVNILTLPFYVTKQLHGTPLDVGIIFSLKAVSGAVFPPVIASLADSYGRATVLYLSSLGVSFGLFAQGFSPTIWLLAVSNFWLGIFVVILEVAQVYFTDVAKDEATRRQLLNWLQTSQPLACLFGPLVGGVLSAVSWSCGFFFTGVLSLAMFFIDFLYLQESPAWLEAMRQQSKKSELRSSVKVKGDSGWKRQDDQSRTTSGSTRSVATSAAPRASSTSMHKKPLTNAKIAPVQATALQTRTLMAVYVDGFFRNFSGAGTTAIFTLFFCDAIGFTVLQISYLMSLVSAALVCSTTFVVPVVQSKYGHRTALLWGTSGSALSFFLLCACDQSKKLLAVLMLVTLNVGNNIRSCSQPVLIAMCAPDVTKRGHVFGRMCLYGNIGRVVGTLLCSFTSDLFGVTSFFPFFILGCVSVCAVCCFSALVPADTEQRLVTSGIDQIRSKMDQLQQQPGTSEEERKTVASSPRMSAIKNKPMARLREEEDSDRPAAESPRESAVESDEEEMLALRQSLIIFEQLQEHQLEQDPPTERTEGFVSRGVLSSIVSRVSAARLQPPDLELLDLVTVPHVLTPDIAETSMRNASLSMRMSSTLVPDYRRPTRATKQSPRREETSLAKPLLSSG
ncbi:unnamed protein product [Amoebophrya sp. A120]|nr:unnamed protein product [Amoebophrya sp. A120]|eukprot:GSA120T00020155001.1